MRIVLQRVKKALVSVKEREIARINDGFLLLVGVGRDDTPQEVMKLAHKISKLRVFEDKDGKMNLDIKSVKGEVLSVPQFTLLADLEKGNRPAFDGAGNPEEAKTLWNKFNDVLRSEGINVAEGEFGAHMGISLINDGPVTFVLDSDGRMEA